MTSGIFIEWWLRTESNRRHEDFQSSALPTELQSQLCITCIVHLLLIVITPCYEFRLPLGDSD